MGKVLILYFSQTGHTEKMAKYVAEGVREIPGIELRLKSIASAGSQDIHWCDGLALGSPTHLGTVAAEMKKFWENITPGDWQRIDGKFGCAFSSQGGWGGGAELTCQALMTIMMNFGFLCFGVTDYVAHQFTAHYGATQAGEPRQDKELDSCRRLGRRLAEWVAVYVDGRKELHPLKSNYSRRA